MKQAEIIKVLKSGGKIGGHSMMLIDRDFNSVGKVSRATVDKMIDAGMLTVVNQAYKLA